MAVTRSVLLFAPAACGLSSTTVVRCHSPSSRSYRAAPIEPGQPTAQDEPAQAPIRYLLWRLVVALLLGVPLADLSMAVVLVPSSRLPGWQWVLLHLRPVTGAILGEEDVWRCSPRQAAQRTAAVPQERPADFAVTVAEMVEMVEMGRTPHKRPFAGDSAEDRAMVAKALEQVGLTALAGRARWERIHVNDIALDRYDIGGHVAVVVDSSSEAITPLDITALDGFLDRHDDLAGAMQACASASTSTGGRHRAKIMD
jgi:hypothetical protein